MREVTLDPLEERIESFEDQWSTNHENDLRDFLPPTSDPNYNDVAVELMRIDLERRWKTGRPKGLNEYQDSFSDLLAAPEQLHALAFEEYRCRLQAGEKASPEEYRRRFGVSTDDWPPATDLETDQNQIQTLPSMEALRDESDKLVDSIQLFPQVDDRLLDFRLTEQLGQGTFGTVMLARQGDLADRQVVLKISSSSSLEPQHLARLQHTNIVPIYSFHRARDLRVVCMPFFGRTTLADFVRKLRSLDDLPATGQIVVDVIASKRGGVSESAAESKAAETPLASYAASSYVHTCVSIAVRLAEGLEHAHQRGILHRDIKPANVLLTDEGRPMLLDFNISDEIVVGGKSCLFVGGTLPYMSPEQRRAMSTGRTIDQRSDVYSFGVLLHELLCGKRPAEDSPPCDEWGVSPSRKVSAGDVRRVNRRVPPSLASIVAKCLSPDAGYRFQTMTQVREDLQRHLDDRPLKFAADRSVAERIQRWCRRHPRISSGSTIVAVAACLLVTLFTLMIVRDRQGRQYEALAQLESVSRQLPELRVLFGGRELDASQLQEGGQLAARLAGALGGTEDAVRGGRTLFEVLPKSRQSEAQDVIGELYYLAAIGQLRQSELLPPGRSDKHIELARALNEKALAFFSDADAPAALRLQQKVLSSEAAPHVDDLSAPTGPLRANPRRVMYVQELIRLGQHGQAADELKAIRRAEPLDFSTWFLLGNAYVALGKPNAAEGCFTTCAALWPESYLPWFHRGLCRYEMGKFTAAEEDFNHVLTLRADSVAAHFNRALCRKARKDYLSALADLDRVHELQGDRPRVLLVRARVHDSLGNESQAARDREIALQSEPLDARGWMALALARVDQDPHAALADLRRAQQIAPGHQRVQRNIAYVLGEHLNRTEEAAHVLTELIREHGRPDDMMSYGVMLARLGRRSEAIREGLAALQIQRDGKLSFQMACIYALNADRHPEDVPIAVGLLAESIARDPNWLSRAVTDGDLARLRKDRGYRATIRAATDLFRAAGSVRQLDPPGARNQR